MVNTIGQIKLLDMIVLNVSMSNLFQIKYGHRDLEYLAPEQFPSLVKSVMVNYD